MLCVNFILCFVLFYGYNSKIFVFVLFFILGFLYDLLIFYIIKVFFGKHDQKLGRFINRVLFANI
jgi:hypothetical protein